MAGKPAIWAKGQRPVGQIDLGAETVEKVAIVDGSGNQITSFGGSAGLTDTQLRATPVPVSGTVTTSGLTDAQLRASAVPVSLATVPSHAVTVVDGGDAATGTTTDLSTANTVIGRLKKLISLLPAALGSSTSANSLPVVIASDQGAVATTLASTTVTGSVAVTGPLTDAQLRAASVPVSGTVTATGPLTDTQLRATAVPVSGPLTDTQLRATPVPVSGSVTATVASTTVTGSVAVTGPVTDTQLRATPVPVSGTVATGGLTDTQLRASVVPVSLASTTVTGTVITSDAANAVDGATIKPTTDLVSGWDGISVRAVGVEQRNGMNVTRTYDSDNRVLLEQILVEMRTNNQLIASIVPPQGSESLRPDLTLVL